jgi:signal transduction histidine kinase/PAS domain-containing protein
MDATMDATTGGMDDSEASHPQHIAASSAAFINAPIDPPILVPVVNPGAAPSIAPPAAGAVTSDLLGAIGPPTQRAPGRGTPIVAKSDGQPPRAASSAAVDESPAESASPGEAAPKPKRSRARKKPAEPDANSPGATTHETTAHETSAQAAPKRAPRTTGKPRKRGSGVSGLAERARLLPEWQTLLSLPDALFSALPTLRQAILNRPLDEGLPLIAEGLALALAPAVARIWIADVTAWSGGASRVGGSGMSPALRLRAHSHSTAPGDPLGGPPHGDEHGESARSDPLVEEVSSARAPTILFDAVGHPLARGWTTPPHDSLPALGTLAGYPLRARGQFLGVLAVGAAARLSARQLAALEELADLVALAADRDRLLSYSRGQEALAQTVVRHAPVAMALVTGPEYLLALANPAFAALLGVESDTPLAGRRLSDVLGERAQGIATTLRLDAAYAGDEPQAMIELPIHRRPADGADARVAYWNVSTSPVIGLPRGGALVAAVEVTRQVTARRRAQDSAEVAEQRLRQMMSLHAAALAVASQLDTDPRELLADLLHRSLGLLAAQAGTIYVRDPRHDTLEVVVSAGLRRDYSGRRLEGDVGLAGHVSHARRGLIVEDYRTSAFVSALYRDEPIESAIAAPLIHHNEVVGVLEVLGETARRSFTQADLWLLELFAAQAAQAIQNARMYVELERAYRKQRELDRLKDDFISTASHELRTPLTGVQGFLELLVDLPAAQADPMVISFARKAYAAAEELAEIAERLLQTSRLDSGRLELHAEPVPLAPLVDEVLSAFRELRQAQSIQHELRGAIPPELAVVADRGRLKEVLDNLVGNGLKYSPQGGQIEVGCEPFGAGVHLHDDVARGDAAIDERPTIELPSIGRDDGAEGDDPATQPLPAVVAAAAGQPYVMITVRDDGMGIPPGERARLFGRFARLDGARLSQIRGTGLGLYICRQLARAMGGDVWLRHSAPGEGSTFAIALPAVGFSQLQGRPDTAWGSHAEAGPEMRHASAHDEPALVPALTPGQPSGQGDHLP